MTGQRGKGIGSCSTAKPPKAELHGMDQPCQPALLCHHYGKHQWSFVVEPLELFSWQVRKTTFLVLDNAGIYKTPAIGGADEGAGGQVENAEGKVAGPVDYLSAKALFYAATKCLDAVGKNLKIRFSNFNHN